MEFLRNIYRRPLPKLIPNFAANFQAAIMKEIYTPINGMAATIHAEAWAARITSTTKWA